MGSPRLLLRLRRWGLPAALVLHALVLVPLVLSFRDLPPPAPARVIEVLLVPPPPRPADQPPPPAKQIQLHRPERVVESETPPLLIPQAKTPTAPPSEFDLEALRLAPFAEPDRAGRALRARNRCNGSSLPKTAAEWNDCPPAPKRPADDEPKLSGIPEEKESAFKRAAENKKAWKKYRESTNPEAYPGLRCAFGRDC